MAEEATDLGTDQVDSVDLGGWVGCLHRLEAVVAVRLHEIPTQPLAYQRSLKKQVRPTGYDVSRWPFALPEGRGDTGL